VQAAIDAAAPDDTLVLCAGDYAGNVTIDRDLMLIGAGDDRLGQTRLMGTGGGSVVTITAETLVKLQLLRITGGDATEDGGGIVNHGTLTLNGCTVSGNTADENGGGIYNASDGFANFTLCTIIQNEGKTGGGIYNNGTLWLNDSDITANAAYNGGGVYNGLAASITLMNGTSITGNTSTGFPGGGIRNHGTINTSDTWDGSISGNIPDNCVDVNGTGCPA
jgi:hypothetical protein